MDKSVRQPQGVRKRSPKQCLATPNQKRFLLGERFSSASYIIPMVYRIDGELDASALRQAVYRVFERHDALRTYFALSEGVFQACIHSEPEFEYHEISLASIELEVFRAAALPIIFSNVDTADCSSMSKIILGKAPKQQWRFCFALHHAVTDGFSRNKFFKEVVDLYSGRTLPPVASYYDFNDVIDSSQVENDIAAWRDWAKAGTAKLSLQPEFISASDEERSFIVEHDLKVSPKQVNSIARNIGSSKFGVLAAAYAIGVGSVTGSRDVVMCFQNAGRKSLGAGTDVIGPFSNTLPMRLKLDKKSSFEELARMAKSQTRFAVNHESVAYHEIVSTTGVDTQFVLNAFPKDEPTDAGSLRVYPREFLDRKTEYAMNLMWSEESDRLQARIFFDRATYTEQRIELFLKQQIKILSTALHKPDTTIEELSAACRHALPPHADSLETTPVPDSIASFFLKQVSLAPDALAVCSDSVNWSYRELFEEATKLAVALGKEEIACGDKLAIFATRSPDFVASVVGALLVGIPFAVFDASYPNDRLKNQMRVLGATFAIGAAADIPDWVSEEFNVNCITPSQVNHLGREREAGSPAGPAYYLFTSGTTGLPKCVGHPDEALIRFVDWEIQQFGVRPADRVSLLSGLSHDPMLRDIFVPLFAGASIVVPDQGLFSEPEKFRQFLIRHEVTITHLPPPLGRLLAMGASANDLASIRQMVWGGDILQGELLELFSSLSPNAKHLNLYGATETPQAALIHAVEDDVPWDRVPLGKAVPWFEVDVINEEGEVCGIGEVGDLRVTMPYEVEYLSAESRQTGSNKIYVTGDRAFALPSGDFMFVGRVDDQVKVRGFRIELEEVNIALRNIQAIGQAATLAQDTGHGTHLTSYVELASPNTNIGQNDILQLLGNCFPDYMVPDRVFILDKLPLLPNGKIDRTALANLKMEPSATGHQRGVAPKTVIEKKIAKIFESAAGLAVTDIGSSLIDLGADSLSIVEARLALESIMHRSLPNDWASRSISALSELVGPQTDLVERNKSPIRPLFVETYIPLRAVAIFSIVAHHMGWYAIWGWTNSLFMIAGFSFAEMQLRVILDEGRTGRIWAFVATLLLSSAPVLLAIYGSRWLMDGYEPHLSTIGYYVNFLNRADGLDVNRDGRLIWLWYIHCYCQIFVVLALLLTVAKFRNALRRSPFQSAIVSFIVLEVIAQVARILFAGDIGPSNAMSAARFNLFTNAPTVVIGIAIFLAQKNIKHILIVVACIGTHAFLMSISFIQINMWPFFVTAIVILCFPKMPIPAFLVKPLVIMSGASLYIYLTHRPLENILELIPVFPAYPAVYTITTVVIGAILWEIWKKILHRTGVRRIARLRISVG